MQRLADLLMETGQGVEAVIWMEKMSLTGVLQMSGFANKDSRRDCMQLGFGYAKEGRYVDAIYHFQQTIEQLTLTQSVDTYSRDAYIEEIRVWIVSVEDMRGEAEALEIQPIHEMWLNTSQLCSYIGIINLF